MEEETWLNALTVEPKMPMLEKAGKWLVARTKQGREHN
jgi:hypothetical protein